MEQVKFYHDLGKNRFSKPLDKVAIYAGVIIIVLSIIFFVYDAVTQSNEFITGYSYVVNLFNGLMLYALGSGRFVKAGKHFVKITNSAISYKLNDGGEGTIPFREIKNLEFAKSYIEFTLRSGKQIRLTHNTLPYFVIRAIKDELQAIFQPLSNQVFEA